MNTHEWPCRIKSARRKKKLVIKDRDKQLLKLDRRQEKLVEQQKLLPMIPLLLPYQRGWKRFFVLSDAAKLDQNAAFYQSLLEKINTVEYSRERSFKQKKWRKQRFVYKVRQQVLREFTAYSWHANKLRLTEEEMACFERAETFDKKTYRIDVKYFIREPWQYELKIVPNIVTHTKVIDREIETELACIDNRIENFHLWPRIRLLTRGKSYGRADQYHERGKYVNKIKNLPRYSSIEAYLDLEI